MVRVLLAVPVLLLAAALLWPVPAQARTAQARITRVVAGVGTMERVRVELDWPDGADAGALRLRAARVDAPSLGQHFVDVDWHCRLRRDAWSRWHCSGPVSSGGGTMSLTVDIGERGLAAQAARGATRIALRQGGDATQVDLTAVPLAWLHGLLAQAWPEAQLKGGDGDASLRVASDAAGVHVAGPLRLRGVALDTPDGRIAAEGLGYAGRLDMQLGDTDRVRLDGDLTGGEALFGTTYLDLAGRRIGVALDASQRGACCWRIPRFDWRGGAALHATGSLAFGPGADLRDVAVDARSTDLTALRDGYLSGWLGAAGLSGLGMQGGVEASLRMRDGTLTAAEAHLDDVALADANGRFAFDGLDGDARFAAAGPVDSVLAWRGGSLYGLAFEAARLPMRSAGGEVRLREGVAIPVLGGRLAIDHLAIRPPTAHDSADIAFGLELERLDVARLAEALHWPAFTGQLSGRIPNAHYHANALTFDGGLSMEVFGGRVDVSALAMERPFGVAPTLGADLRLDDLDLQALTGVLGFGSITGLLDGRIDGLRLVDWQPVAFDASLRTDRRRGVPRRISQRAVQDLSSVGDASFVGGLQSTLIGFFDDFGYSRIGLSCRLVDEVCDMGGLAANGPNSFVIVEGAGIPHLSVIGINRRVDWPTLVERLMAVGKGESKPVVE